jgi:hypothetical protein
MIFFSHQPFINVRACFLTFVMSLMSFTAFADSTLKEIPDFESLVAEGSLNQLSYGSESNDMTAELTYRLNYEVEGQTDCHALVLSAPDLVTYLPDYELSPQGGAVAIAICGEEKRYYICSWVSEPCSTYFKTKKSKAVLSLHVDRGWGDDELRFRVEYYDDKLIFRVQDESCLIPYPHGCLIDGFGWEDWFVFTFTPDK